MQASKMHMRTDAHTSPTETTRPTIISTGVILLQEKVSYIQIQIQPITTIKYQYIGEKDIQVVIECWAYQQTHPKELTESDLTDTACTVVYMYGLLLC